MRGNGSVLKFKKTNKMESWCKKLYYSSLWYSVDLLINKFSYRYSEKRARNPIIILWAHGRLFFLPAGCLLMWKQAHFTFKSTSVFAWIKFLLQLAKSEWPQGFTNKYVCYVFIILNTKICKHKSYLLKNKTRNTSKMGKKNSNTNRRFKDYSFLVCQLYHLM